MPVVYNGVPGTGQGDLFQGLKLWIARRVPQRAHWVDLVEGNGGKVATLEKNADMLIADNIKVAGVSPPLGSYMWRWIDDSVKNGFLQDKDDYLIGHRQGSAREIGSSEPTKIGRTAFTKRDDVILARWAVAEERMGHALSGKLNYQALERRYPHHTWQSWRERWVKALKNRPRPTFSEEEIQAEIEQNRVLGPDGASRRLQLSQAVRSQPRPPNTPNGPSNSPGRAPIPAALATTSHTEPTGKTFFTEEEDRLLLAYIEALRQGNRANNRSEDKNLSGNEVYRAFAQKYPAHSWHSWRDRWIRHLRLEEAVDDAGPDHVSNADAVEARSLNKRKLQQTHVNRDVEPAVADGPSNRVQGPSSSQKQPNPKSDDQRLERKLRERKVARAALIIEKTWRGYAVRRDIARLEADVVDLQSRWRGYVARMRMASLTEAHKADSDPGEDDASQGGGEYDAEGELLGSDVGSHESSSVHRHPRAQFFDDLEVVSEAIGAKIDREPIINGQRIDLWDLYSLARHQDCELEARDWKLVAEGLGFEPVNGLVWKVQGCYLQNLAEFEHHMKRFENTDGVSEEAVDEQEELGRGATEEGLQATSDFTTSPKRHLADPSSAVYQSSPPLSGSKRPLEHTDLLKSSPSYPSNGPRKRRRLDRNSVIPPTPDEKLGLSNKSSDGPAMQDKSSPLKLKTLVHKDTIEVSSGEDSDKSTSESLSGSEEQDPLPTQTVAARKKFSEPETQEWHISQNHLLLDGEDDVSSSQQLPSKSHLVKSWQQVVPGSRNAVAKAKHPSSPDIENVERRQGLPTRVLRSNSERVAIPSTVASSSRAPVNGQVRKRTLPASYQRQTASTATAIAPAAVTSDKPVLHTQAPAKGTIIATRPASAAPYPATNGSSSRPRQVNAYTTISAVRSSTNLSFTSSPPEPPEFTREEEAPTPERPETWDEAHVEAQLRHFEALGYKRNDIVEAMKASTMSRGPMIVALESLHNGKGLPEDEPGVWTPRDRNCLDRIKKYEREIRNGKSVAGSSHETMKQMASDLEKKHGKQIVEERREFLRILGETEGF